MFDLVKDLSGKKESDGLFYEVPFTLTIHTPLHIGGGDTSHSITEQYIWSEGDFAYLLNEQGQAFIYKNPVIKGQIDQNTLDLSNLKTVFHTKLKSSLTSDMYRKIKIVPSAKVRFIKSQNKNTHQKNTKPLHDCIRQPDGQPYIPGSSLKGALLNQLFKCYIFENGLNNWENISYEYDSFVGFNAQENLKGLGACLKIRDLECNTDKIDEVLFLPNRLSLKDPSKKFTLNYCIGIKSKSEKTLEGLIYWDLNYLNYLLLHPKKPLDKLTQYAKTDNPIQLITFIHKRMMLGGSSLHKKYMNAKLSEINNTSMSFNLTLGKMQGYDALTPYNIVLSRYFFSILFIGAI
jgi:hypothetical protein